MPQPDGNTFEDELLAVDARTPTDAWAAGTQRSGGFVVHWDGRRWKTIPDASPVNTLLVGVVAIAAGDVWAAGMTGGRPVAEHWDGHAWTTVPVPVGAAIEHWDGSTWSIVPVTGVPDHTTFSGVSARSATDVWASGNAPGGPVIVHWNGSTWASVPIANATPDEQLKGIAATPDGGRIIAVGHHAGADDSYLTRTLALSACGTNA